MYEASISDWSRATPLSRTNAWKAVALRPSNWTAASAAATAAAAVHRSTYDVVVTSLPADTTNLTGRRGVDRCIRTVRRSSVVWFPFIRQLISNFVIGITLAAVITMSSISSFVISPDVLLYAVTLLSRLSDGKCWCFICLCHFRRSLDCSLFSFSFECGIIIIVAFIFIILSIMCRPTFSYYFYCFACRKQHLLNLQQRSFLRHWNI